MTEWMRLLAPLALLLAQGTASAQSWPEEDYNPHPGEGDVVLPMPCEGAIVFRRVETGPSGDDPAEIFADRRVRMGWAGAEESAFINYVWSSHVAGGLIDERARYYLIGKYEVTRGQYQAVMGPNCPDDNLENALPQGELSWYDAVDFTRRYMEWLNAEQPQALPEAKGSASFVRLPTEAEWEFAVRGGLQVSEIELREERFPMEGELFDYAWHQGTDSADGQLQYIGMKKANPIGLYDVYGNVDEIVLDPFRLNRAGRLHGQPGGFIVKGGSIALPASALRSATRQEFPFFSRAVAGPVRVATTGVRVAISAPASGDLAFSTKLQSAWEALSEMRVDVGEDPLAALREMAKETDDQIVRARLLDIAADFDREMARRNEIEAAARENLLLAGGVMARRLVVLVTSLDHLVRLVSNLPEPSDADPTAAIYRQEVTINYDRRLVELRSYASVYGDTLIRVVDDYSGEGLSDAADRLANRLVDQGRGQFADHVREFARQAVAKRGNPEMSLLEIVADLVGERDWLQNALLR